MAGMSVGGLASGLDTNSIIAQLTALEQAKVTRELKKKENAQGALDKFKDLETRLGNLQLKAKALELPKDFNVFKASSNYEDYATVSGGEGATAGQYELVVHQLASTQKVASNSFKAINEAMSEHKDWNLAVPSGDTVTITLSPSAAQKKADPNKEIEVVINKGDTLKDIVNKINAAEGSGVKASIMSMADGSNRLILTAVDTGSQGFFLEEKGGSRFLTDVLGVLDDSKPQQTVSSSALITDKGAATLGTLFSELNVAFNSVQSDDKFKVKFDVIDTSTNPSTKQTIEFDISDIGNKSIKDVLKEINDELEGTWGFNNLIASINASGEIVFSGNADDVDCYIDVDSIELNITDSAGKPKIGLGSFAERNNFANPITEAVNAFYVVDGIAVSSQSNSDDKTINGTTFNLKKADPLVTVKLSLEADMEALADKIGAFIEEFNALLKFIDENTKATVEETTNKETGRKENTRVTGVFTGDAAISGLRENLRSMLSSTINELTKKVDNGYTTAYSAASMLGIVSNKEGFYDFDKEKLTKALNADFEGVRRLFTSNSFSDTPGFSVGNFNKYAETGVYKYDSSTEMWYVRDKDGKDKWNEVKGDWTFLRDKDGNLTGSSIFTTKNGLSIELPSGPGDAQITFIRGIAGQISNFVEKAKSGYQSEETGKFVDGFFKQTKDIYQRRIDDIQKRADQLQIRVDNFNTRLINQFNSLERSMSTLQSQTSNMLAALGNMNYGNK